MKNVSIATVLIVVSCAISPTRAEPVPKKAVTKTEVKPPKAVPTPEKATGPVGYGPIQLGMTRKALEALDTDSAAYLRTPLDWVNPENEKYMEHKEGVERFRASVVTPLSKTPIKSTFSFVRGQLEDFTMYDLDDEAVERIQAQITGKYGPGQVKDDRKEERCVYKNGSNWTVTSGAVSTQWAQKQSESEQVVTSLVDSTFEHCPVRLDMPRFAPLKSKSLSFTKKAIDVQEKKNLF